MPYSHPLTTSFALACLLALSGCGSSSSGSSSVPPPSPPPGGEFSVSGQLINGPIAGAEVEVRGPAGALLATVTSDATGAFSVKVEEAGPYSVTTLGGELDGQPYQGALAARCVDDIHCAVTPYSTAVIALKDRDQVDYESARLLLGNQLGLQFDPFEAGEDLPPGVFNLAVLREFLNAGNLLGLWIDDLLAWLDSATLPTPAGVVVSTPGPDIAPDSACTDFEVVVDEPHYLVDSHASMAAALEDPENKANGRLVIGVTADIDDGPDGPAADWTSSINEWWLYNGTDDLVLIGWREGGARPVIDMRNVNRGLRVQTGATVTVSGLEFHNGNARSTSGIGGRRGGAIAVTQRLAGVGQLRVHDSIFRDNRTNENVPPFEIGRGGAIHSAGFIQISHSEFHDNFAREGGGAVYSRRGINVCHSRFEGNRIFHGSATVRSGSAIMLNNTEASGDLRIHDSVFIGNEALSDQGGVLYLQGLGRDLAPTIGEIIITESEFIANSSATGAAVIFSQGVATSTVAPDPTPGSADVYIIDSRIADNFTTEGGPIIEANEARIFIYNSVFENNEVSLPQSLVVASGGEVGNSTFSDNSNPVFAGDFSDQGSNLFLGSSSDPFGPAAGRIAFHDGGRIWLVAPDGDNRELLLDVGFIQPAPTWSPDGSELAYVGGPAFRTDLFRYSLGDGQVTRLTDQDGVRALEPAWSISDEIAYIRRNESQGSNPFLVYVTGPQGGEGVHLTGGPSASDMERFPSWSPDGDTLLFSVREDWSFSPAEAQLRLYTINRDGTDRIPLPGFANADQPAWSPDGERVAYVEDGSIFVRRLDGSDAPVELATGDSPSWAPDGLELAFHDDGGIYRVSLASPGEVVFITEGDQPAWSN